MIGIIGAMEEEVAELKKDMQIEETVEMAGMVFCKGTLGGKDVVIVRSGIGKVNAGICTQILADLCTDSGESIRSRYIDQYRYCRLA